MTDLLWDFEKNDLVLVGDRLAETDSCSLQNATMIFNKSAASILYPELGIGFEEIFANLPMVWWSEIEKQGEGQMKKDGALLSHIKISMNPDGVTSTAVVQARYRE